MTVGNQALALREINDETLFLSFFQADGTTPKTITGMVIEVYFKPTVGTADGDASVKKLSTATGEVTITDGPNGLATVAVAATGVTATPTGSPTPVFRVDLISAGKRKTCGYGTYTVTDL